MNIYEITSNKLSELGAIGETVELTDEELNNTQYRVYLKQVERKPVKKKTKAKKEEPVAKEQEE